MEKNNASKDEINHIKYNVNLYFDNCILNGAKYYALLSTIWDVEIAKCKGYKKQANKKLKYNDLKSPLEQTVKQFVCGLQGYMNDFKIEVKNIDKTIKPQYNKANVLTNGEIKPFEAKFKIK